LRIRLLQGEKNFGKTSRVSYQGNLGSIKIPSKHERKIMSYMKKLSVVFLLGLFILAGFQSVSAQTPSASITVQYDGIKQVGVSVVCEPTNDLKVTDSLGEVKFFNGITSRSAYWAYYNGFWHACLDDCDGPAPAPNHFHCEIPLPSLGVTLLTATGAARVGVPLIVTDMSDNIVYGPSSYLHNTQSNGIRFFYPPYNAPFKVKEFVSGGPHRLIGQFGPYTTSSPKNNYYTEGSPTLSSPANNTPFARTAAVTFTWGSTPGVAMYDWFIQHQSGAWASSGTKGTSFVTPANFFASYPGTWYWCVDAYDSAGNCIGCSYVGTFTIL
jgi:hypothetical protein